MSSSAQAGRWQKVIAMVRISRYCLDGIITLSLHEHRERGDESQWERVQQACNRGMWSKPFQPFKEVCDWSFLRLITAFYNYLIF